MYAVTRITVEPAELAAFCARHGIRELAAFGSVLRKDFDSSSDIDLLVDFLPGRVPGLLRLAQMELELERLFGREVELRTYEDLSPYFRDDVRRHADRLYVAA
jgi:predicted nucleotidyltransferase